MLPLGTMHSAVRDHKGSRRHARRHAKDIAGKKIQPHEMIKLKRPNNNHTA